MPLYHTWFPRYLLDYACLHPLTGAPAAPFCPHSYWLRSPHNIPMLSCMTTVGGICSSSEALVLAQGSHSGRIHWFLAFWHYPSGLVRFHSSPWQSERPQGCSLVCGGDYEISRTTVDLIKTEMRLRTCFSTDVTEESQK